MLGGSPNLNQWDTAPKQPIIINIALTYLNFTLNKMVSFLLTTILDALLQNAFMLPTLTSWCTWKFAKKNLCSNRYLLHMWSIKGSQEVLEKALKFSLLLSQAYFLRSATQFSMNDNYGDILKWKLLNYVHIYMKSFLILTIKFLKSVFLHIKRLPTSLSNNSSTLVEDVSVNM